MVPRRQLWVPCLLQYGALRGPGLGSELLRLLHEAGRLHVAQKEPTGELLPLGSVDTGLRRKGAGLPLCIVLQGLGAARLLGPPSGLLRLRP